MEKCWASVLGDCGGGISREHVVSGSLFTSQEIDVKGFSWCKDEAKRVGLASLTKKCLCRPHNSKFSPIDQAAAHAFDVLRKQTELLNDRAKQPNAHFKKVTFSVNATALEKWLLKTLINFSYDGDHYIGHDSDSKGRPSSHLVKVAFGLESFRPNNGMYVAYKKGGRLNLTDTVKFAPIIKDGEHIHGGKFSFRGILLFMDISPEGMTVPFANMPGAKGEWCDVYLSKRFRQIKATHAGRVSHVINFSWT